MLIAKSSNVSANLKYAKADKSNGDLNGQYPLLNNIPISIDIIAKTINIFAIIS
jgi:hypothetical protein